MSDEKNISYESYEILADEYFTYIDEKPYNADYERPGTLSLLPDVTGKKVLDAGCAAGWYTKWLLDHEAEVTAIDFSPNMIEMTKKRVGDQATILLANLNDPLNFDNKSFDLIISSLVLHYLKDWEQIMGEFNRILRPSGHLVFSVHHPFMDFQYFKRENYFATELLQDEWTTHSGKVKVQFYRRPLNKIIAPVLEHGFILENLIEPMPTEKFKVKSPRNYEKLCNNPQFLFLRARKIKASY